MGDYERLPPDCHGERILRGWDLESRDGVHYQKPDRTMRIDRRFPPLAILLLACQSAIRAASWTAVALAPSGAGTMILLTDGTVMVEESDRIHWMRLTPDAQGSYIRGTWTTIAGGMTTPRLYFASQVLPSGKVWVVGGEYTGVGIAKNWGGTSEIFDPGTALRSATSPFPSQTNCPRVGQFGGSITSGSAVIANIASTAGWQTGWTVSGASSGSGIAANAVIVSVDSPSQIHVSGNSTKNANVAMVLTTQATGNTTSGSTIVTGIPSTAGYQANWIIGGPGIPSGATISSVDSATQIHISSNATATGTAVALALTVQIRPQECFGDDPSILLPGGKVMTGYLNANTTYFYDPAADAWLQGPNKAYNDRSDEEGWAKMSDGTILTYDIFETETTGKGYAEKYDPVANKWFGITPADGTANGVLPVLSSTAIGSELGPVLRLSDDRMFVIGANGHTALYTPITNTWAAGPDIIGMIGGQPFLFAADDAAAAVLPNGHVILAADAGNGISLSGQLTTGSPVVTGISSTAQFLIGWAVAGTGIPTGATILTIDSSSQVTLSVNATATGNMALSFAALFSFPAQLFDFDPTTNLIGPVSPVIPDTKLATFSATPTRMLMLPTGQLLFADGTDQLWAYTPDGSANSSLRPAVTAVASNGGGSFTLTGTQINGQSAGAAYGDDVQMDENYPIVSFVNAAGNVYYGQTTNWSYTGVAGGSTPQTVDFTLNPKMPAGSYSLVVSAAGISSNPTAVTVTTDLSHVVVVPMVTNTEDAESARTSIVSGQWTAIYGQGLSNSTRAWNGSDFTSGTTPGSPLPTVLDGVSVTIGGKAAAVYYISPTQIDVQAPSNLPLGSAGVVVSNNGTATSSFTTTVTQSSPSFFFYQAGANLFPAAVHLSGKLVGDPAVSGGSVEAAHPGEVIELYANGLAASPAGVIVTPATFTANMTITAGSYNLTILAAVLVSAGQYQINVQLPSGIPAGNYSLTMTVPNGSTSTAGVTIMLPVGP